MKNRFALIRLRWLILAGLFLVFPLPAGAELFYFKDEHGAFHFSNVPDDSRYQNVLSLKLGQGRRKSLSSGFDDFRVLIERSAKKFEVDPLLIRSLIKVESDYDPYAVSGSGAQGLMQLMPETARRMNVSDSFNPEQNIEGGVKYFKQLLSLFNGQLIPAIAAYHAGENMVIRYNNQVPPIEATQKYVKKVVLQYYQFHGIKNSSSRPNQIFKVETPEGDLIFTNRPATYEGLYKEIAYK